jgi:hypothetical protein
VPELKALVEPVAAPEPPKPEPPPENADNEYLARGMTGDEAAEQLQQLSMTGLPYGMAMQAPGAVAAIAKEKEQQDIAAMSEYTPSLKAWREANPHRTAISRDKFKEMGVMEWLLKAPGQAVNRSYFRNEITNINMHDMDGTMTPEMAARRDVLEEASSVGGEDYGSSLVGRFLTMPAENVANIARTMTAGGKLSANAAAAVATTSLLLKLPPAVTLEATALAMKSGAIIGSGIEEGRLERANAFREYTMIPGVDREAARLAANVVGIINGAFGMTEAKILFDSIPAFKNFGTKAAIKAAVGAALKDPTTAAKFAVLAKEVGASFGEGVAQEVGQRASTILGEHYARAESGLPLRSAGEIVGDIGAEAEGAAFMYPLMLLPGASIKSYRIAREHKYSENRPDKTIDKLNEAATKIPFAKSPETYKSFVKEAAAGTGKETAYVNLEGFQTLYQTQDEDPREKAVELFGSAEAYDEAVASGGPIAVPIEQWTATVSQSSNKSALSEHMSFDPDGMTRYEYEAAQAEADKDITAEDVGAEDAATTDLQALEDDIRGQLVGSAHTPESADTFAKFLASGYGAAASRSVRSLASIRAMFDPIIKRYMPGLESAASNTKVLESQIHMIQMGQGPTDKDMYGDSVLEFIRKNGGLKYDKGGELKGMDARFQSLINEAGKNLDDMAGMAQEAGYITEHDQNALLELIADELGGKKAYSTRNINSNAERMNADLNALHDAIKAFDIDLSQTPQQIAKQLHAKNNEQVTESGGDTLEQAAYHGSPHNVKRFDLSKIGTGEGKQLYGWGIYFAELKEVAKQYVRAGRNIGFDNRDGVPQFISKSLAMTGGDHQAAIGILNDELSKTKGDTKSLNLKLAIKHLSKGNVDYGLYNVDIPDDAISNMLDWDKSLRQQPESVRKAIEGWVGPEAFAELLKRGTTGMQLYSMAPAPNAANRDEAQKMASEHFRSIGIPGLRYLDGDSRLVGEGTRNTVVWDQSVLDNISDSLASDTLFQKQGKAEPKGSVTFTGTQAIIKLFKAQDRSTFIHEGAHIFLRMLIELTKDGNGTPQMQADMQTLMDWWKITSPDQITVEHEEKFAKGFEKWVAKGEAPSLALRDVFAAMSAWLMRVYSGIVHRGIAVSPAVEDVMKRMMATDAEITAAMEQKGALDLLTEIDKQNILAPEEMEAYRKDIQRKHDDAVALQLRKLTAAKEKAERDMSKSHYQAIKDEVAKQVHAMRVYRAIFAMRDGTTPDGIPLPNVENLKFNAADLAENYGTNARGDDKKIIKNPLVARLRELGLVASGQKQYELDQKTGKPITRNGKKVRLPDLGMRLEDVARVTGYNTADEMVEELASSPDMNEAIKAETERRMRVEHPDVIYDGTLAMEAVEEVTSGETGLAIALAEQRAMRAVAAIQRKAEAVADRKARNAEKSAGPPITLAIARQYAKSVLWNKPIGQIKPEQYRKIARAAALKAIDAVKAKDFAAAVKHKRTEILNIALYTEARKIEKSVTTKRNQMLALTSVRMRQVIGRAGEGYLEQIEALLAQVEMKKISDVRRRQIMPLQAFVQALQAEFKDGEIDPTSVGHIPPKLSEFVMSGAKPYQEMTVAEFNALHDDVIQLATLARGINKLLDDKAKQTLSEGQEALAGAVRDNARDGRQAITHNEMRLPQHKLMRGLRWFAAHHRNFASHVREVFDGLKDNGVGFKLLLKGLQKAGDTQAKMHRDATLALGKAAKIYNKRERLMMTRNPKIVPGTNIALTHMGRLMFTLNLGNADNTNKMMQAGFATRTATDARGNKVPIPITKAEVRAILDTLTAKDVKFLNNIWAQIDSYYDAVAEKEKKIRGIAAPRVVATPFDVKAGHLTGGYLPIEGEQRASVSFRNQLSQSAERLMSEGGGQILPSRDFTHERQAKAKHPPFRLDFSVVTQHIAEVTHYLSYYEYVMDTARLLGADNVRNSVVDVYGDQVYGEMRNALKRVAAGHIQQSDGMAGMAARWRVGASAGGMALNMLTAIVQLLGVIPAMTRVGPMWIAKGFVSAMAGGHGQIFRTRGWIRSQSQFMANRKDVMNREMAELNDRHFSTSLAETAFKTAGASFFWLIAQMQSLTDTVIWMGAYEKALAEKKDGGMGAESHEDAVLLADRTIRDTQGSGQIGDLSGMMSGGQVQRLFTTFYSYMNQMQMLSAETIAMARQMGGAGGAAYAFASLALIVVVPVVLQEAIYAALRGDWDDDEPEEIATKLARSTLAAGMGLFVGAREVSGAVEGFHQYSGPAGMGPVAGAVTLVGQAQQGEMDRAFWKAALTTASGVQPIPTTQIMRLYDAVEQDQYNQVRPAWMVAAFGKPAK